MYFPVPVLFLNLFSASGLPELSLFSVCLITLSGFLFPELSQSPLSSRELLAAKAAFVQQFTAYRLAVRRNTICFQIWLLLLRMALPLPSLCSGRNSEPSNPTYPLRVSHDSVALLLHPPSVISFPDRTAWCTQLFPRQKTFHTFWIIPAALLSNISKSAKAFVHGKENTLCRKTHLNNLFLNDSRFLTDHGLPS